MIHLLRNLIAVKYILTVIFIVITAEYIGNELSDLKYNHIFILLFSIIGDFG